MAWAPIAAGVGMQIISGLMSGDKNAMEQFQTLTPEQQKFLKSEMNSLMKMQGSGGAYGQGMNILQQYLDPESDIYKNFEQPYLQEFEQQTIPNLAERFAGAGANGGALSSSGFGQALSSAGANLQTNLAQMKSNLQRSAVQDIFAQYNNMANRSMATPGFGYQQKGANPWTQAMAGAGQGLMQGGLSNWASNQGQNSSYMNKYPLTGTYDQMFRSGAWS